MNKVCTARIGSCTTNAPMVTITTRKQVHNACIHNKIHSAHTLVNLYGNYHNLGTSKIKINA